MAPTIDRGIARANVGGWLCVTAADIGECVTGSVEFTGVAGMDIGS